MVHHNPDLFYAIYNTINEYNQRYLFLSDSKALSITLAAYSLIMIFMLFIFECIIRSSWLSKEEIKLFAIAS